MIKSVFGKKKNLLISPHQDDEAIVATLFFNRLRDSECFVLYATNGAPKDIYPAKKYSRIYRTQEEYKKARREEAIEAMDLLGICKNNLFFLDIDDKELNTKMSFALQEADYMKSPLLPSTKVDGFFLQKTLPEFSENFRKLRFLQIEDFFSNSSHSYGETKFHLCRKSFAFPCILRLKS